MPWRFLERLLTFAAIVLIVMLVGSEVWNRLAPSSPGVMLRAPWMVTEFVARLTATFWVYAAIPAILGLAMALIRRMPRTAGVLLVALVISSGPWAWSLVRPIPAPTAGRLTVFSANLLYGRADVNRLIEQIKLVDPDVIMFQEVDGSLLRELTDRLASGYPHIASIPRQDAFGQATFSRLAFTKPPELQLPAVFEATNGLPQIVVTIRVDDRDRLIEIHNVHTVPPVSGNYLMSQDAHARAMAEHQSDADAVILIGDFNSPDNGSVIRLLRDVGYLSTHAKRGRGIGATWPDPERRAKITFLGLKARIDHVLYAPSLVCTDQGVSGSVGSDHRPVWASFDLATSADAK